MLAGDGVCVLDPHGDMIDFLLARIPPEREADVILFDAAAFSPLKEAAAMFKEEGNAFFYPLTLVHLGNVSLGLGQPG